MNTLQSYLSDALKLHLWLCNVSCCGPFKPSTIWVTTCAREDVIRVHYCVSLLPSHSIFRHLQKTHVWTEVPSPSKGKAEVL